MENKQPERVFDRTKNETQPNDVEVIQCFREQHENENQHTGLGADRTTHELQPNDAEANRRPNNSVQLENETQQKNVIYERTRNEPQLNDIEVTHRSEGNKTNILELYDVYEKECVFKVSEEEVEFIQTGIETLVHTIVDSTLSELKRMFGYMIAKNKFEAYFNINNLINCSKNVTARGETIEVGSFYEGTRNNFPDEFDFIIPLHEVQGPLLDEQGKKDRYPKNLSFFFHSTITEVTSNKTQSLKYSSQTTAPQKLYFDQYLQRHGPSSMLRFIYNNSKGLSRKIHVVISDSQQSETGSNQFNLSKQGTEEIVHYKVPLACWPKLHHTQKLVTRLIGYCHDVEDKSEQQEARHDFPSEHVVIFVKDKTFDIACLPIKPEILDKKKTEWYYISENVGYNVTDNFTGIFVDSNGVKLVQMISESTIFTDHSYGKENSAGNIQQNISNMIEIAIFQPLLEKVKLLKRLQGEIEEDETQNVRHVLQGTDKLYRYEQRKSPDSADFNKDFVRKNKRNKERLLGEMIALTRRSSLPESLRTAVIGGFETKQLSKQVTKGLFEIDQTIKYCGFRYSTLHIKVEPIPCSEKNQRRKDQIERYLMRNGITDFQLDVIESQIKEYMHFQVGEEIQSEYQKKATLGCFSMYTKKEKKCICALLSKHFVQGSTQIFVGNRNLFGTVLPNTNKNGGYDISAAEIVKHHTPNIDPTFKNFENIKKPAHVLDNLKIDIEILQDQPVYLRGAITKLGVGTIQIPRLESCEPEMTLMQLIDGNFTLGEPDGRLAVKGDSGSIICTDDLDQNKICLLSMFMGEFEPVGSDNDGNEKMYTSLYLSSGLRYLEDKTDGRFSIEEAMTDKDNGDEC